jgi:hypothetical protein
MLFYSYKNKHHRHKSRDNKYICGVLAIKL